MNREPVSIGVAVSLLLAMFGCASDDDDDGDGNDTTGDDDDDASPEPFFYEDIEDYDLGPLGDPWVQYQQEGAASAEVVELSDDGGRAIQIDGGGADGDFIWYDYAFAATEQDLLISFEVYPHAGSYLRALLLSAAGVEIAQVDYSAAGTTLWGYDHAADDWVECHLALAPEQWIKLSMQMHFDDWTYDILLDDDATPCAGMAMSAEDLHAFAGIRIGDLPFDDTGGLVDWDNFAGFLLPLE